MNRRAVLALFLMWHVGNGAAHGEVSVLQTERLRQEQARALLVGREMRVWHFTAFPEPMQDWPREVKGAFVELRCEDNQFSEAALILVRDDLRIRSYPAKQLTPEDRALADKLEAARETRLKVPKTKPYTAALTPYTRDNAHVAESDHFVFYYGDDRNGSGKAVFDDPDFIPRQERWFEKTWTHLALLGAPMPMSADPAPHKINVYITGTGLEHHKDGFPFGGENVVMHPNALGPGSSVVIHEFTHSVQFYSKGFRDSPFVGWFWECHANWSTHQYMPAYPPVLAHYAGRAHYELNSSRHNYGSWPFLQTLAENPRFGYAFPYAIWPACKRNEHDGALEDPFQTIMRMGTEHGVWRDGVSGFGDVIGALAARMAAWDFQNQYFQQREMRNYVGGNPGIPSNRTVLEPVADRPGWWKPIFSHAPRQYGINIVDLIPEAPTVEADFAGIVDETEASDWRVTLVAHDALGHARYSPTVHGGKLAIDVQPGESVALAVAATPDRYEPLGFRIGYGKKRRYPYEVTFRGAKPASAPPLKPESNPDGAPHPNGGGFIAKSAHVAPTAYVGPNARVLDAAEVSDRARVEDFAVVRQAAKVSEDAVVCGYARITDRGRVCGHARVGGFARLGDQASIGGNARLLEYATIDGRGTVDGDVLVKGFGEIHLQPATKLTGGAICGEDLEVHFLGSELPEVRGGMIYGYLNADLMKKELGEKADNHYLYAHWSFSEPRKQVLLDANADCQGVLRGNARIVQDKERRALLLDGRSYALVEGSPADCRNATFDLQLQWAGGADGQRLFEFGSAEASVLLAISRGKPVFVIHRGKESAVLQSAIGLTPGKPARITVTVKDGAARIYVDGNVAGANKEFTLAPEDVRASAGRIGAGVAGAGFSGKLYDVAVYRTGVESLSELRTPDQ